jgi:hypothetical protein
MPGKVDAHHGVGRLELRTEIPPESSGLREAMQEYEGRARTAYFDVEGHAT